MIMGLISGWFVNRPCMVVVFVFSFDVDIPYFIVVLTYFIVILTYFIVVLTYFIVILSFVVDFKISVVDQVLISITILPSDMMNYFWWVIDTDKDKSKNGKVLFFCGESGNLI